MSNENIVFHEFEINQASRIKRVNQQPKLIWFTGLSGSGKSTLSSAVEKSLFDAGYLTYSLDGDNTRKGINSDLSFSDYDRKENIRRIAEISKLMLDAGLIVCASFVSPFKDDREKVKSIVKAENFIEIYVSTPIEECEKRDTKGFYARARNGEIPNFTGISSPYEEPTNPDIKINTTNQDVNDSCKIILEKLNTILNDKL